MYAQQIVALTINAHIIQLTHAQTMMDAALLVEHVLISMIIIACNAQLQIKQQHAMIIMHAQQIAVLIIYVHTLYQLIAVPLHPNAMIIMSVQLMHV
jgi:hypothetical protein